MPFTIATGVYTPPAGATNAITGQVIQSAIWNTIHADISTALTNLAQGVQPLLVPISFHNVIGRNGSFDVWQRGAGSSASITVTGAATVYTADGWYFVANANQTCAVSAQNPLVNGSLLSGQFQRNSGSTGVAALIAGFPLDTDEAEALRGHSVVLSFVASTGANWSPTVGLVVNVFTGTGTPAKQVAGFTNQANPLSTTVAIAASTTKTVQLTGTAAVGASVAQAEVQLSWTPVGTAGASDFIQFDDVQLEVNLASTLYDRIPFDVALQRCKRHYQKTFPYSVAPAQSVGVNAGELQWPAAFTGTATASGNRVFWRYPVGMRANPALTTYNPAAANAQIRDEFSNVDCSSTSASAESTDVAAVTATGNASTTAGNILGINVTADAGI